MCVGNERRATYLAMMVPTQSTMPGVTMSILLIDTCVGSGRLCVCNRARDFASFALHEVRMSGLAHCDAVGDTNLINELIVATEDTLQKQNVANSTTTRSQRNGTVGRRSSIGLVVIGGADGEGVVWADMEGGAPQVCRAGAYIKQLVLTACVI